MSRRALFMIGVAIVVALVAIFATRGFQQKSDISGTIGAANRYQSQQVAASDVGLKDPEVQAFLQSDLFHRLQTDTDFRNFAMSEGFQQLTATAELARVLNMEAYAQLSRNEAYQALSRRPEFAICLAEPAFKDLAVSADFARVIGVPAYLNVMGSREFATIAGSSEFAQLAAMKEFQDLAARTDFQRLMMDVAQQKLADCEAIKALGAAKYADLVACAEYQKVLDLAAFGALARHEQFSMVCSQLGRCLQDANVQQLMRSTAFMQLAKNEAFTSLLAMKELAMVVNMTAFQKLMTVDGLAQVYRTDLSRNVMTDPRFVDLASRPYFLQALQNPGFQKAALQHEFWGSVCSEPIH